MLLPPAILHDFVTLSLEENSSGCGTAAARCLPSFHPFCMRIAGVAAQLARPILQFEADSCGIITLTP
jgi:hypothetical protein